ncbi:hypothetical protein GCM10025734_37190 [Kitasatospora paranensis]
MVLVPGVSDGAPSTTPESGGLFRERAQPAQGPVLGDPDGPGGHPEHLAGLLGGQPGGDPEQHEFALAGRQVGEQFLDPGGVAAEQRALLGAERLVRGLREVAGGITVEPGPRIAARCRSAILWAAMP